MLRFEIDCLFVGRDCFYKKRKDYRQRHCYEHASAVLLNCKDYYDMSLLTLRSAPYAINRDSRHETLLHTTYTYQKSSLLKSKVHSNCLVV